jgi:hypothetical protein
MLSGWEVSELSVAWRSDQKTWVWGSPQNPTESGVALVTARRR